MPLEDKDNQGGTWVHSPNEYQLVNQESTKIKKGWWEKNKQLSEWYKEKKRSYSMDYKPSLIGKSDKPPSGMFVTNHFKKRRKT